MGIFSTICSAVGIDLNSYLRSAVKTKPVREINVSAMQAAEEKRQRKRQKLRSIQARASAAK